MEFLQLKYFYEAARTQNFSKVAAKYAVPTSAVSQGIRRLENELGVPLFDRNANRIMLNEEGQVFVRAVEQMNKVLDNAKKQLADTTEVIKGEVRLQILCGRRVVYEAIKHFNETYPEVVFVLNYGQASDEAYDLILSDGELLKEGYSGVPLVTEDITLACSREHPMAAAKGSTCLCCRRSALSR